MKGKLALGVFFLASKALIAVVGMPIEKSWQRVEVFSIGDASKPAIEIIYFGYPDCVGNVSAYIEDSDELTNGQIRQMPFGRIDDPQLITLGFFQSRHCVEASKMRKERMVYKLRIFDAIKTTFIPTRFETTKAEFSRGEYAFKLIVAKRYDQVAQQVQFTSVILNAENLREPQQLLLQIEPNL